MGVQRRGNWNRSHSIHLLQVVASLTLLTVMIEQMLVEEKIVKQKAQYYGSENDLQLSILKIMIELDAKKLKVFTASFVRYNFYHFMF